VANSTQLLDNGCDDDAGIGMGRQSLSESGNRGGAQSVANPNEERRDGRSWEQRQGWRDEPANCGCHADGTGLEKRKGESGDDEPELAPAIGTDWWATEPDVGRVAHGVAARVDRLKAIGNGQVPACAAEAWRILSA
jgi:hypothetical protein